MMPLEDVQLWIEKHIDTGEPLPPEAEERIANDPECRGYFEILQLAAETLGGLEFDPPPRMADDVMQYIQRREQMMAASPIHVLGQLFLHPWRELRAYLSGLASGPVFQREAWPAVLATLAIVWGVFAAPGAQSDGQDDFRYVLECKIAIFTGETVKRVESMAQRVTDFASELWRDGEGGKEGQTPAAGEDGEASGGESPAPGKDLGMKYSSQGFRNFLEAVAKPA